MSNPDEPSNSPKPDQWYDVVLDSNKLCNLLRYEFKPASIGKNRPGTLHQKKDKRVSVEFENSQPGKRNVTFEGGSEDCKENEAVLFFDGEKFRLVRLHRAVKLHHVRTPGESAAAGHRFSPPAGRAAKSLQVITSLPPDMPVKAQRIEFGKPENSAEPAIHGNASAISPEVDTDKNDDREEHHKNNLVQIFGSFTPENENAANAEEEETVDVDREGEMGLNAAEVLKAQVNTDVQKSQTSSSSNSSGSSSSSDIDAGEYVEKNFNKQLSMTEEETVDVDGEGEMGLNAAEVLKAQVNTDVQKSQTSSSSNSSGTSSSSDADGPSKRVRSGSSSSSDTDGPSKSISSGSSSSRGSGGSGVTTVRTKSPVTNIFPFIKTVSE